jgi:hypothetical protein
MCCLSFLTPSLSPSTSQVAGNNLSTGCVYSILSTLSLPEAPAIKQIDFSSNTVLNWQCAYPIALALGCSNLPPPVDSMFAEPSQVG